MTSSGSNPDPESPKAQRLDPLVLERCRDLVGLLFPWDRNRALELALLKTFLPSLNLRLLHQTGEFEQRPASATIRP